MTDRDETIRRIRAALKRRSGRAWSVKGGRGTAWGWIRIDAPPARRTWRHRPRPGYTENTAPGGDRGWEAYDTGDPGGSMGPADRLELAKLLGLELIRDQGVSIAANSDYYREYIDRAEGREPSVIGKPYWD